MFQQFQLPKLQVGCSWVTRPSRSIKWLTSESGIPVIKPQNLRHFVLLSKYRPTVKFYKQPTAWDWAAHKARQRLETSQRHLIFQPDTPVVQTEDEIIEPELPDTGKTDSVFKTPVIPKHISKGWPDLHTARRMLIRQRPRGNVSNEELYASLRKPPVPDILGPNWKAQHRGSQTQILQRGSARAQHQFSATPNKDLLWSRLPSARSQTMSLTSSSNVVRSSLCSATRFPMHKSAHVVTYVPKETPVIKDNLPADWKEHHKKRQARILQQREERKVSEHDSEMIGTVSCGTGPVDGSTQGSPRLPKVPQSPKAPEKHVFKEKLIAATLDSNAPILEAQLDIMKDRLRTQIRTNPVNGSKMVDRLRNQITDLNYKYGELKILIESMARNSQIRMTDYLTNLITELRCEILAKEYENISKPPQDQVAEISSEVIVAAEKPKYQRTPQSTTCVKLQEEIKLTEKQRQKDKIQLYKPTTFREKFAREKTLQTPGSPTEKMKFWVPESAKTPVSNRNTDIHPEPKPQVLKVISLGPFNKTAPSRAENVKTSSRRYISHLPQPSVPDGCRLPVSECLRNDTHRIPTPSMSPAKHENLRNSPLFVIPNNREKVRPEYDQFLIPNRGSRSPETVNRKVNRLSDNCVYTRKELIEMMNTFSVANKTVKCKEKQRATSDLLESLALALSRAKQRIQLCQRENQILCDIIASSNSRVAEVVHKFKQSNK